VSRETYPPVPASGVCSERPPEVDGGFLKHLRGDLVPPGEPGHRLGGCAIRRDYQNAAGALADLPGVEGLDQVKLTMAP
jgi:hypothetical protein